MKYVLANFSQGNAPFILCGHLAKQIHESSSQEIGVIFPLVYGERQKRILREELGDYYKYVFFDKKFGEILKTILYSGENFENHLKRYVEKYEELQKKINEHLKYEIKAENFNGEEVLIPVSNIICEVSRNPYFNTPIQPSFYTGFAFYSEILEKSKKIKEIRINTTLLSKASRIFKKIENSKTLCFIQTPNSFSYDNKIKPRDNEIIVPPFYKFNNTLNVKEKISEEGAYVTISGIPGLENFYEVVKKLNLKLYSSKEIKNTTSQIENPEVLKNKNILFHFCRAGWGSIAKSIITEKPILTLPYQKGDDPEIFFNNKTLSNLNLALFFNENCEVKELLNYRNQIIENYKKLKVQLKKNFGTLNAFKYAYKYICSYLSNQEYIKLKNKNFQFKNVKKEVKMSKVLDYISCRKHTPIIDVMKIINRAPHHDAPTGICLITEEDGTLQGIVTDGDIRRAILGYVPLSYPVEKIMTRNPITVPSNISYNEMVKIVRKRITQYQEHNRIPNNKINHIITVDENGKVKKILSFFDLFRRSEVRTREVCIIGLGYVGLTLALTLAEKNFHVVGVDLNDSIINSLKQKKSHIHEKGINKLLEEHINKNFMVYNKIPDSKQSIYVICVGTPVNKGKLDYTALKNSLISVGKVLKQDDLVILRSTVSVGTSRNKAIPWLEESSGLKVGTDFFLSFAPERTVEGNALNELKTLPQIIGGFDETSVDLSTSFFKSITNQIITVDSLEEAEIVKLINNTYRDVTFAFSNELAIICDKFNINAARVIRAANNGYPRGNIPLPSPGVGGTCLKKDSYIFCESASKKGYNPKMAFLGRKINEKMIHHVVGKINDFFEKKGKKISDSKIFVLGFAFKGVPETSDIRDSTTLDVIKLLKEKSAEIYGYDPVVPVEEIKKLNVKACSLEEGFKNADCVLIMNNHPFYVEKNINNLVNNMNPDGLFFDTWNLFDDANFKNKINYSTLGITVKK